MPAEFEPPVAETVPPEIATSENPPLYPPPMPAPLEPPFAVTVAPEIEIESHMPLSPEPMPAALSAPVAVTAPPVIATERPEPVFPLPMPGPFDPPVAVTVPPEIETAPPVPSFPLPMPAPLVPPVAVTAPPEIETVPHEPRQPPPMPAAPQPPRASSVAPSSPESEMAQESGTMIPADVLPETRLFAPAKSRDAETPSSIFKAGRPETDAVERTRSESVTVSVVFIRHDTSHCVFEPETVHSPEIARIVVDGSYVHPPPDIQPTSTPLTKTRVIMCAMAGAPSTETAQSWLSILNSYSPSGRYMKAFPSLFAKADATPKDSRPVIESTESASWRGRVTR